MSTDKNTVRKYDVLIVGSGMVGTALAVSLADTGLKIGIADPNVPSVPPGNPEHCADYDLRVSAITERSQDLLSGIGVWDLIDRERLSPYQSMTVWDGEGTGRVRFSAAELHVPALGTIVENREIIHALHQAAVSADQIEFIRESVTRIDNQDERGRTPVYLSSGEKLSADLLVGADGALSRIRQWGEFGSREWDYHHHALVATVKTEKSHQQTAWQRFRQKGPLAFLPMSDDHICSIVWSTSPEESDALLAMDDEAFGAALGAAFEFTLGKITQVGPRASFPLRQRHAKHYVVPGIALIGDAAHTIHPLAGQGVNLGFMDVAALAEEIRRAHEHHLALGNISSLKRYERRRQGDNLLMMSAMEGFKRLFEADTPAVRWLRNQGMRLFDRSGVVKQHVVMQAMGMR